MSSAEADPRSALGLTKRSAVLTKHQLWADNDQRSADKMSTRLLSNDQRGTDKRSTPALSKGQRSADIWSAQCWQKGQPKADPFVSAVLTFYQHRWPFWQHWADLFFGVQKICENKSSEKFKIINFILILLYFIKANNILNIYLLYLNY